MEQWANSERVTLDVRMVVHKRRGFLTFCFTATILSSSIKALATSLGLKRNPSKSTLSSTASSRNTDRTKDNDELAQNSKPYASLPPASSPPQTDHFILNPPRMSLDGDIEIPLPGHFLRPGIPVPANARLSLGLGLGAPSTPTRQNQPTTTIRLISNPFSKVDPSYGAGENGTPQLQPFKTTFDLILASPTPGGLSSWPPKDPEDNAQMKSIYPALTVDDLPPSLVPARRPEDLAMLSSLTPPRQHTAVAKSPEPFIFGSPLPQHNVSNNQFRVAAASVLEEMSKRLRQEGVDEIQTDIIAKLHPDASVVEANGREIKPMPGAKRGEIKEKFQKLHESEFEKMEGIDGLVKRRAERSSPKRTSEEKDKVVIGKKRKSSAIAIEGADGLGPRRPTASAGRANSTRVISNGRRSKVVIPGAFGSEEEEAEETGEDARTGKRARIDPELESSLSGEEQKKNAQDIRLEKEKEVIRKKLEANRAKRRSSAAHGGLQGRKSGRISTGRPSLLGKASLSLCLQFLVFTILASHHQLNLNPSLPDLGFCHLPNRLFRVSGIVERIPRLLPLAISPSLRSRMRMSVRSLIPHLRLLPRLKWVHHPPALQRKHPLHLPAQRQLSPAVAKFLLYAMPAVNQMQKQRKKGN